MALCKPLYSSVSGLAVVTELPNFANFNEAESNPILRFDQTQLTVTNVLNNALLINLDNLQLLADYPSLNQRFQQGAVSDTEFADFLLSFGFDLDTISDIFIGDFPVNIDLQVLNNFVERVGDSIDDALAQLTIGTPGNAVTVTSDASQTQNDPITDTGSGIQIPEDDTPPDRFIPLDPGVTPGEWTPGPEIENYLQQLNQYYDDSFGTALGNSNLCTLLSNPFAKLASVIAAVKGGLDLAQQLAGKIEGLISDIKNFSIAGLISDLTSKIKNIQSELLGLVDNLKEKFLGQIENLKTTALNFIKDIKAGADRIFKQVNKKIQELKDFFSDVNIDKIKNKLKNVIQSGISQFEELRPDVLNMLGVLACGLGGFISSVLSNPVDKFKGFLDNLVQGTNIARSWSIAASNIAIRNGGLRIDPVTRENDRKVAAEKHNSTQPNTTGASDNAAGAGGGAVQPGNYITLEMSEDERSFVAELTEDGNDFFIFADSVKNMGKIATEKFNSTRRGREEWDPQENYPTAGWNMVARRHPFIFAALKRVSDKLQNVDNVISVPLTIISAFRSRWYNRVYLRQILGNRGAAKKSMHMSAMALDISTRGLSAEGTAKLIQRLSEEGFKRISVYNTFVHADIAEMGNYRGNWTKNYRGSSDIRRAMQIHLADGFRKGTPAETPVDDESTTQVAETSSNVPTQPTQNNQSTRQF